MKKEQKEFFILLEEFRKLNIGSMLPNVICHGEFTIMKTIHGLKELRGMEENIRVSDIVEEMQVPAPAVSRGLRGLEERGMITRRVDEKDRRNTFVDLTEEGQKISDEVESIMAEFADAVFARMGAESFEQLNQNLSYMVQASKEEIEKRKYIEKKGE